MKITALKVQWTITSALVDLNDDTSGGCHNPSFNRPRIALVLRRTDSDEEIICQIQAQRESCSPSDNRATSGQMDTKVSWTDSYGSHVQLVECDRWGLHRGPFKLDYHDAARVAVLAKISKLITKYNLGHVSSDEIVQVAKALDGAGVSVRWEYGGTPLYAVEGLGANRAGQRAEQQAVNS